MAIIPQQEKEYDRQNVGWSSYKRLSIRIIPIWI